MKNNYINILLISGSGFIGGIINYIYHPIMLQYMTLEEFGEFGSLVGLFSILAVFTSGLGLFLTREVARNIQKKEHIKNILYSSMRLLGGIGLGLFLVYQALSPFIANFLESDLYLVRIVGTVILTSFLGVGIGSTLTGMRKFEFIGLSGISHPLTKLLIGGVSIYLGFGVLGALFGFVLSGVLSLLGSFFYINYALRDITQSGDTREVSSIFMKNKLSIGSFLFVSVFFSLLMNADILLVRHMFPPEIAGAYAGISIVGKFLLYMLLSIETVYYGQIMEYAKRMLPIHLVRNSLALMCGVSLGAIVFNYFFGSYVLTILSSELTKYTQVYLIILLYYSLLAFISIFSKVLIGWGVFRVNWLMLLLCVSLFGTLYFSGVTQIESFALILVGNIVFGVALIGGLFLIEVRKHKREF